MTGAVRESSVCGHSKHHPLLCFGCTFSYVCHDGVNMISYLNTEYWLFADKPHPSSLTYFWRQHLPGVFSSEINGFWSHWRSRRSLCVRVTGVIHTEAHSPWWPVSLVAWGDVSAALQTGRPAASYWTSPQSHWSYQWKQSPAWNKETLQKHSKSTTKSYNESAAKEH